MITNKGEFPSHKNSSDCQIVWLSTGPTSGSMLNLVISWKNPLISNKSFLHEQRMTIGWISGGHGSNPGNWPRVAKKCDKMSFLSQK